jgi:hypothetical protein
MMPSAVEVKKSAAASEMLGRVRQFDWGATECPNSDCLNLGAQSSEEERFTSRLGLLSAASKSRTPKFSSS